MLGGHEEETNPACPPSLLSPRPQRRAPVLTPFLDVYLENMPVLEMLEALNERIRIHEAELADLKEQRNGLIRACSMPSEILANIFMLVQHRCRDYDGNRPWMTYSRYWMEIMLVCRRFRCVAVQTASLWSYIDYEDHGPRWRALCFHRSGTHPLCVYDNNGSNGVEYFPMARVRSVAIERPDKSKLLHLAAPQLQYFQIFHGFEEHGGCINIDDSFLGGMNLQLLDLSLKNASIRQVPVMASLRRLVLKRVSIPGGQKAFRQLFEQIPVTEEVCLENCMDLLPPEHSQPKPPPVTLPHLQSLCIFGEPDVVSACLCILPLPRLAMGLQVKLPYRVETGAADLGSDHTHIFQHWLDFIKHRNGAAGLTEGTLVRSSGCPVIIRYGGDEVPCDDFSGRSPSFCHISCLLSGPHPVLNSVTALHLLDNMEPDARHGTFDRSLNVDLQACFSSNVQDFILEGSEGDLKRDGMPEVIKEWIVNCGGRIQRIRFIGCNAAMGTLADELRREELVPDVSWEVAGQPGDE
jgi:hypothetical protein